MEKTKKLRLALGEGSHTHIMHSKEDILFKDEGNERLSFELQGTGVVTHEEHDKIVLPTGKFRKYPQQEFDPFSQENRNVFD